MTLRRSAAALLGAAVLLLCSSGSGAQVAVPHHTARVIDRTGTLSDAQRGALEQRLAEFEDRKGSQIAVLIVPTTDPETVEQYSLRVAEQWKLGRKGVDDGVLLLVAKEDRSLRIEVGYGLEGALTDADSARIIREVIVPLFRHGDFHGGIEAGVDRIISVIDGEPLPAPERQRYGNESPLEPLLPIIFVMTLVAGGIFRALLGRVNAASATGGVIGIVTWLFIGTLGVAIIAAVLAFLFTLLSGGTGGRGWSSHGRHGGMGGGWSGSSGGGFSGGGGGSFGGGGASGRW